MTFQSLAFPAFLGVTLAVCLTAGRRSAKAGRLLLGAFCLIFYLWSMDLRALGGFTVLFAGACVTALTGWALSRAPEDRRRQILAPAVCWQIAVLLIFKYAGFLTGGRVQVGWAPLGLSFFTFQQLWLLREMSGGRFCRESAQELGLFAFFFPTVSSGPILRPGAFFPQLHSEKFLHPDWQDAAAGVYAIGLGLGKKVLLADALGVVVQNGWDRLDTLNAPEAWLVILGYTLQLYFDFSGYCDIASGAARLLGVRLPLNFDSPYRALSVGEFWKRWHITLTDFLRECVYFPLGGSRRGTMRTCVNILLVFLISGVWHGAGWTFLVWGGLHGLAQIFERLWGRRRDRLAPLLRWAITFAFVNAAWVFFRAPDLGSAGALLTAAVRGGAALPGAWLFQGIFTSIMDAAALLLPLSARARALLAAAVLYGVGLTAVLTPGNTARRMDTFRPTFLRGAAVLTVLAWSVLSLGGGSTFLYTNF